MVFIHTCALYLQSATRPHLRRGQRCRQKQGTFSELSSVAPCKPAKSARPPSAPKTFLYQVKHHNYLVPIHCSATTISLVRVRCPKRSTCRVISFVYWSLELSDTNNGSGSSTPPHSSEGECSRDGARGAGQTRRLYSLSWATRIRRRRASRQGTRENKNREKEVGGVFSPCFDHNAMLRAVQSLGRATVSAGTPECLPEELRAPPENSRAYTESQKFGPEVEQLEALRCG